MVEKSLERGLRVLRFYPLSSSKFFVIDHLGCRLSYLLAIPSLAIIKHCHWCDPGYRFHDQPPSGCQQLLARTGIARMEQGDGHQAASFAHQDSARSFDGGAETRSHSHKKGTEFDSTSELLVNSFWLFHIHAGFYVHSRYFILNRRIAWLLPNLSKLMINLLFKN